MQRCSPALRLSDASRCCPPRRRHSPPRVRSSGPLAPQRHAHLLLDSGKERASGRQRAPLCQRPAWQQLQRQHAPCVCQRHTGALGAARPHAHVGMLLSPPPRVCTHAGRRRVRQRSALLSTASGLAAWVTPWPSAGLRTAHCQAGSTTPACAVARSVTEAVDTTGSEPQHRAHHGRRQVKWARAQPHHHAPLCRSTPAS
jgi:hypothetical protein